MLFVVGLYFQNNNKKKQKMIWPILEKIVNTYSRIWLLILVPGFPIYIYISPSWRILPIYLTLERQ